MRLVPLLQGSPIKGYAERTTAKKTKTTTMRLTTFGWDMLEPLVTPAVRQATCDRVLVENICTTVFPSKSGMLKATGGTKAMFSAETGITPNVEMGLFGDGGHRLSFDHVNFFRASKWTARRKEGKLKTQRSISFDLPVYVRLTSVKPQRDTSLSISIHA